MLISERIDFYCRIAIDVYNIQDMDAIYHFALRMLQTEELYALQQKEICQS